MFCFAEACSTVLHVEFLVFIHARTAQPCGRWRTSASVRRLLFKHDNSQLLLNVAFCRAAAVQVFLFFRWGGLLYFFFLRHEAGETEAAGGGTDLARLQQALWEWKSSRYSSLGCSCGFGMSPLSLLLSLAVRRVRGTARGEAHAVARLLFSL